MISDEVQEFMIGTVPETIQNDSSRPFSWDMMCNNAVRIFVLLELQLHCNFKIIFWR